MRPNASDGLLGWVPLRVVLGDREGTEYAPVGSRDRSPSPAISHLRRFLPPLILLILGIIIGSHRPLYLSIYTRRPATIPSFLPPALPPPPVSLTPPTPSLPPPKPPIPNIVHYVYGLAPPPQPDFPYFAYLGMRSALQELKPDRIMFHCATEPQGYWWERVKAWEGWVDDEGETRGLVEVVRARDVEWVGSQRRPVKHFAHKADIIRLEVLLEHGGIYLDIDTFVLRPFSSHSLLRQDVVMGMESRHLSFLHGPGSDNEMEPKGLCNAVIVARPGAEFLQIWLDSYEGFREGKWSEHSVEMPWTLAKLYPTLITVLSERAFFWPMWAEDHIHAIYETAEYDFEQSGQLTYHAWESMAKRHLAALDPSTITTIGTSFTRMAKKYREKDELRRWRAWGRKDGVGSGTGLSTGDEEGEREQTGDLEVRRRRKR